MTYRANDHTICAICRDAAYATCPRCGRPVCLAHAPARNDTRCVDCELTFDRKRHRVNRLSGWAFVVGFAAVSVATGLGIVAPLVGAFAAATPFRLVARLQRRRFLREGAGSSSDGLELTRQLAIAPSSPPSEGAVQTGVTRLVQREPPCSPIWARTFGH